MSTTAIIVVVLVLLALVGVFLFPRLARGFTAASNLERCAQLQAELDAMGAGTDPAARTAKLRELQACRESAVAAGAELDLGEVGLKSCASIEAGVRSEWAAYKTVQYHDPAQRENKRGSILRGLSDLVQCYRQATTDATTRTTLQKIRNAIVASLEFSREREQCFGDRAGGCDRSGFSEPEGMDKVRADWAAFRDPVREVLASVDAKLAAIPPASSSTTAPPASPFLLQLGRMS